MKAVGWLLDVYVEGGKAVLWISLENGEVVRLTDRYTPDFYVEPKGDERLEDLANVISSHPNVTEVLAETKFTSVKMGEKKRVLHVYVDHPRSFRRVLGDVERLRAVGACFNIDLLHVQRYIFQTGVVPTSKAEVEYEDGRLLRLQQLDDRLEMAPPPFTSLIFDIEINSERLTPQVERDPVSRVLVFNEAYELEEAFEGEERVILSDFSDYVRAKDPDFLVSPEVEGVLRYVFERAEILGLNIQLGREEVNIHGLRRLVPYACRGRVHLDLRTFLDVGIAGVTERSRFTLAPPGLSARWSAGRTIDSRQCYEALQRDLILPKTRGFFNYVTTAKDTLFRDRGGLILSPKVGLHENVAELDYESMYPHIIIEHNVSYETVTPYFIDKIRKGFLGELTEKILGRRLYFKHLRKRHRKGSQEWLWCEQRQLALKGVLVCIYGYSGCFANRFNNVSAYEEINKIAREILVKAINTAMSEGFEVIYADSDSLFVKKKGADKQDYEGLVETISKSTGLPIALDHRFKFIVLLKQESDPSLEASRRYFGRLTDGELYYRGIELRRRDCPSFLKEFQERLMEILFDTESAEDVEKSQFRKACDYVIRTCDDIKKRKIRLDGFVVSKVLRKPVNGYKSAFPHVVAAGQMVQKGKKLIRGEIIDFLYVNEAHSNPLRRVIPALVLNSHHHSYDREKYVEMALDVAETILSVFGFSSEQFGFRSSLGVSLKN